MDFGAIYKKSLQKIKNPFIKKSTNLNQLAQVKKLQKS
jgi:hypothetical protein